MFEFIVCLVLIAGGLGFLAGVLMAGPPSYDRGWDERGRLEDARHVDAKGFTVVK